MTTSTPSAIADLVTGAEAARRPGVSRERLRQLAARPGFPEPLGQLGRATVWRDADVAEWARQSGRDYRTG
jgi:predicted DNA-binding transcriptional regulator AlpA